MTAIQSTATDFDARAKDATETIKPNRLMRRELLHHHRSVNVGSGYPVAAVACESCRDTRPLRENTTCTVHLFHLYC